MWDDARTWSGAAVTVVEAGVEIGVYVASGLGSVDGTELDVALV